MNPLNKIEVQLKEMFKHVRNISYNSNEKSISKNFLDFIEKCPVGIIQIDEELNICLFNAFAEKVFGFSCLEIKSKKINILFPGEFIAKDDLSFIKYITSKNAESNFFKGCDISGEIFPVEMTSISQIINDKLFFFLIFSVNDYRELQTIKLIQEAEIQKFKAVFDSAPIGILQTNANWECIYANHRWCEICGLDLEHIKGMGWINAFYRADVASTLEKLRDAIFEKQEFKGETRFQTIYGEIVWIELHARPVFSSDGIDHGLIATLSDITYRHVTEAKLRTMAELDNLTGLVNRVLLQDRLQHALTRVDRHGALILLFLDLDGFKNVNDSLGHDAGDLLLIEVAYRLKSCVREEDTVARVGGDEFMILIEDIKNARVASDVSEKILANLQNPFIIDNQEVFITTSIGIAFAINQQKTDNKTLMKQADIALYRAKEEGKNNYQYYSPELEAQSKDRLYLGNSLHRALDRGEFQVFYQLQANVSNYEIIGTESLLRWLHPEKGLLKPMQFIPLLEETGLINSVGGWMMKQAFCTHKKWLEQGLISEESHVSVNLSPRQLRDSNLLRIIENVLEESELPGDKIVIEITESALIEQTRATSDTLKNLKKFGIKIALDDFGTGYSSLTYLKRFPIDYLKIDREFVRDLLSDPDDKAIIQSVIALARSLNLIAIAEGVDSAEKLAKLSEWGCDIYQGYFLNEPCCIEETEKLLKNNINFKGIKITSKEF